MLVRYRGDDWDGMDEVEDLTADPRTILALYGFPGEEDDEYESLIRYVVTDDIGQAAVFEMSEEVHQALCNAGCDFIQ